MSEEHFKVWFPRAHGPQKQTDQNQISQRKSPLKESSHFLKPSWLLNDLTRVSFYLPRGAHSAALRASLVPPLLILGQDNLRSPASQHSSVPPVCLHGQSGPLESLWPQLRPWHLLSLLAPRWPRKSPKYPDSHGYWPWHNCYSLTESFLNAYIQATFHGTSFQICELNLFQKNIHTHIQI